MTRVNSVHSTDRESPSKVIFSKGLVICNRFCCGVLSAYPKLGISWSPHTALYTVKEIFLANAGNVGLILLIKVQVGLNSLKHEPGTGTSTKL